jgi:hypothetical protein
MSEWIDEPCRCLCRINHPEQEGICTADATTYVEFEINNDDDPDPHKLPVKWRQKVDMCASCAQATLDVAQRDG